MSKFKLIGLFAIAMMIAVAMPVIAVETIADNDLVKTVDSGKVYLVSGVNGGTINHIASLEVFKSYGYVVKNIKTVASLADYTVGDQINKVMNGTLIKSLTDSAVYVVSNGVKKHIKTLAVFNGLGYKVGNIIQLPSKDMVVYTAGDDITSATTIPDGALVKATDSGKVYIIESGKKRHISSMDAFKVNNFQVKNILVILSATVANVTAGDTVVAKITPAIPPVVTSGLTVALAANTPASGTLVTGTVHAQYAAPLVNFTFTGNGIVTAVILKRIGVSADSTLSNVYLYDGAIRLTDAGSVSAGNITFSNPAGLFTVSGSKTISVKSDIAINTTGQTVGIQLTAVTMTQDSISGLPVSGNIHTIASATLADVTFGTVTPSGGSIDPAKDVTVWQSTLAISERDVNMTRFVLRQVGSVNNTDINNFRLMADGVQVAAVANLDSNGYITFIVNPAKTLVNGSRTLKVLADIVAGSSRTFQFSLRQKADIEVLDSSYNVNVGSTSTFPVAPTTATTITAGTMTVQKAADSTSGDVTLNAYDVSLGKFTFTAYGEPIKVETLNANFVHSANNATSLRSGRIMVNGSQVGSTSNLAEDGTGTTSTSYTTNFIVTPGTPVTVEIKADIYAATGTALIANQTITAKLYIGSANATKQVSLGSINVPTDTVAANSVTIRTGSIAMQKTPTYPNQATTTPQTAYKIAEYNLSGSTSEDVNLDTIAANIAVTGTGTVTNLSDVYLTIDGTQTTIKGTVTATGNSWSISKVLSKNANVSVKMYATLNTGLATNDTVVSTVTVSGTTANSSVAVTTGAIAGQTITVGTGSITITKDASSPVAAILNDSNTLNVAAFKVATINDSYTVTDLTLTIAGVTTVSNVVLKDGTAILGTKPGATTVTFSGLNWTISANTNKVLTVELQLGPVGYGAGNTGESVLTTLTAGIARNTQGVSANITESDPVSEAMYVYKAIPTVANVALSNTKLTTGTLALSKISVSTGVADTLGWKKMIFSVNKTGGVVGDPAISNVHLYDESNNEIVGIATIVTLGELNTAGTITFVATNEQQISGSKTYYLKADIGIV